MFLCLILMLNLWILGFIWRETANFVVNATTIFLPGDSLDRRASSRTRAIDPFWRQINTWRHKMLKFSPFLIWYAFAIMNSFSWIMIAGEKRCLTSMAVWHQADWHTNFRCFKVHNVVTCECKVQVVVSQGRYEVLFALGRHWILTNNTWHVHLQSENVFEFGDITISDIPLGNIRSRDVFSLIARLMGYKC